MDETKRWVKNQINKGISISEIKKSLVRKGWNTAVVESMVNEVKNQTGNSIPKRNLIIISIVIISVILVSFFVFFNPQEKTETSESESTTTNRKKVAPGVESSGGLESHSIIGFSGILVKKVVLNPDSNVLELKVENSRNHDFKIRKVYVEDNVSTVEKIIVSGEEIQVDVACPDTGKDEPYKYDLFIEYEFVENSQLVVNSSGTVTG